MSVKFPFFGGGILGGGGGSADFIFMGARIFLRKAAFEFVLLLSHYAEVDPQSRFRATCSLLWIFWGFRGL